MKTFIFSFVLLAGSLASADCISVISDTKHRIEYNWNLERTGGWMVTSVTPLVGQTQTVQMTYHNQLNDTLSIFQEAAAGMGANLIEVTDEATGQRDLTTIQASAKIINTLNANGCGNPENLPKRSDLVLVVKAQLNP